ncbi:2033_t:CDS:2, partial [Cetraspora pellucida]
MLLHKPKVKQKKYEALETREEVIRYDSPGHSSFFLLNPNLSKQMHSCIKFSTAAKKKQKEIIKVCTISHLKKEIEENIKFIYHAPVNIVSRNEMPKYIDEYYCLQMIKNAKQFASAFAFYSVIISQDDKAKVPLRISAVERKFKTVQSSHEPVAIP